MENTETNTQPTAVEDAQNSTADAVERAPEQAKTFTQDELDKVVAERLAREKRKYEKRFEGIDMEEYTSLKDKAEKERQDKLKAKGEFERVLKETVDKKDQVINQYKAQISSIKVDGNLTDLAAKANAVNPGQVVQLLKSQVRLDETGEVEVIDPKTGQTRYTEAGTAMGINELVKDFMASNPHFVKANPGGSSSESKIGEPKGANVDLANLDMNNPAHRELYKKKLAERGNNYKIG